MTYINSKKAQIEHNKLHLKEKIMLKRKANEK